MRRSRRTTLGTDRDTPAQIDRSRRLRVDFIDNEVIYTDRSSIGMNSK